MSLLLTISATLKVLNQSADFIIKVQEIRTNFTVSDEIKKISAKLDQDITRKMKSGYELIEFALMSGRDPEFRKQDMEDARKFLQDCIHLSSDLETNKVSNDIVMGTAHYGLAVVCNLQGDNFRAGYHLFNAFKAAPRNARELSPEIYDQFFKSRCGPSVTILDKEQAVMAVQTRARPATINFLAAYDRQVAREDERIRTATEIGKATLKGAALITGVAVSILSAGKIPASFLVQGSRGAHAAIDNIKPDDVIQARERARVQKKAEELMRRVEVDAQKQDDCCRQTAAEYLTKLV